MNGIEDAGVLAEAGQIVVVLEQFLGFEMAVVEGVDEIQRQVAGNQIEAGRARVGSFLVFAGGHQGRSVPFHRIG